MNTMQQNTRGVPERKTRVPVEWFVDPESSVPVEVRKTHLQGWVVHTGTLTRTLRGLASDTDFGYLGCDAAQDHTRLDASADY
jgi:hypothetical protein